MSAHFTPEEHFCVNPHCLMGRWSVTREYEHVWRIISDFDNHPFLVAATSPHCPCCGAQLLMPFEFEGGFADPSDHEEGPLFEFIRAML